MVRSDDWDETNALCNPDQEVVVAWDHEAPEESLLPWHQRFYDGLDVWVASPYGLAGPYHLRHGGAQCDSQGVGYFSLILEKRTAYLRHAVREGRNPRTGVLARRTQRPISRGSPPPPTASPRGCLR